MFSATVCVRTRIAGLIYELPYLLQSRGHVLVLLLAQEFWVEWIVGPGYSLGGYIFGEKP